MRSKSALVFLLVSCFVMFSCVSSEKVLRASTNTLAPTSRPVMEDKIKLTRGEWLLLRLRQERRKAEVKRLEGDLEACKKLKEPSALPWILLGVAVVLGGTVITSQALYIHKKP